MKQLYITFAIILVSGFCFSQSQDENYVVTMTPQTAKATISDNPIQYNPEQVLSSVQYVDGLGRPIQSIQYKASPDRKDIISFVEYDDLGRVAREYLPFTIENDLNIVPNVTQNQIDFH